MERFTNFEEAILRGVTVSAPTEISLRFSVQDSARAYDWIDIVFHISGVRDARLLDTSKLDFVDMSEGLSILFADETIVSVGRFYDVESAKNASLYIVGEALKIEESSFSG